MKKNQIIEVVTDDLNNLGFAVAHVDGMAVFVSGAVDGERLRVRIISVKRNYAVARTEELLTPSPHRITPLCPARGCGGCAYGMLDYAHELTLKRRSVLAAFRRVGMPATEVMPVRAVQGEEGYVTTHYRNKAQYPVTQGADGSYIIGFYGAKSHRVAEAADCPLQPREFAALVETLRGFFETYRIPAYREESGEGLLRHIYLRRAHVNGEILLTLVINGKRMPHETELVACVREAHPAVAGILINVNTEDTNVICGTEYRTLWGRDHIVDELAGVRLRLAAPAFYQVNHDAAELLYAHAAALAELSGSERVLDLFCGCGSIGLSMAHAAREIIGVEIVPEAVECARLNAAESGISNARFFCGDAGDTDLLLKDAIADGVPDVVVLDPPRKGCTPALLEKLAELSVSRIVYISCNAETLARDAKLLCERGYGMSAVTPFDLFPRTSHVECAAVFTLPNTEK